MTARIVVTPEAEDQVRTIDTWWRKERPAAPGLFTEELAAAFALLGDAPEAGRRFPHRPCLMSGESCSDRAAITSTIGFTGATSSLSRSGASSRTSESRAPRLFELLRDGTLARSSPMLPETGAWEAAAERRSLPPAIRLVPEAMPLRNGLLASPSFGNQRRNAHFSAQLHHTEEGIGTILNI